MYTIITHTDVKMLYFEVNLIHNEEVFVQTHFKGKFNTKCSLEKDTSSGKEYMTWSNPCRACKTCLVFS